MKVGNAIFLLVVVPVNIFFLKRLIFLTQTCVESNAWVGMVSGTFVFVLSGQIFGVETNRRGVRWATKSSYHLLRLKLRHSGGHNMQQVLLFWSRLSDSFNVQVLE